MSINMLLNLINNIHNNQYYKRLRILKTEMLKKPPNCYICGKNCADILDRCHYCICDINICDTCLNSVKKNDNIWICPSCHEERNIDTSKLFRDK